MQRTSAVPETIREMLSPFLATTGLCLWGVEMAASGHRQLVRLYLDLAPDTPRTPERQGVTIDECAKVSRHLGALLDMEDLFSGPYVLEVSSPGLSRRFFTADQLPPYAGREIEVKLAVPRDGRKRFRGTLDAVTGGTLTMTVDPGPKAFGLAFAFDEAEKIRLIHAFDATALGDGDDASPAAPEETP
ncbi:MAG: ribosome maturation factor RimP [Solidesulfovibrio sp.]|uniref:ribosome maturation factor RimP n=1 Tax=Solidesulfovibrio sp. TaxID=2910990 RepID=UPI0031587436